MTSPFFQMFDEIVALPIKGESFFLRRGKLTLLVDAGLKGDPVSEVLRTQVGNPPRIDAIVCTHGDADHAGGLSRLLKAWGRERIGQVWLPGRWVNVVPLLLGDPRRFLATLICELAALTSEAVPSWTPEELQHSELEEALGSPAFSQASDVSKDNQLLDEAEDVEHSGLSEPEEPKWFKALRKAKADFATHDDAARAFYAARRKVTRRWKRKPGSQNSALAIYFLGLIDTAEAIRNIAGAAIQERILTRWFDFNSFAKTGRRWGGDKGILVPMNAGEQSAIPEIRTFYMHLSLINRESLVFLAPPTRRHLGVLFSADSPLGTGINYTQSFLPPHRGPLSPVVVTAPHHGSETNQIAYTHLLNWTSITLLLRSGGRRYHPGPTFLKQHRRLCAQCPKGGHPPVKTGVILVHGPSSRLLFRFGRICCCR